MSSIIGEIPVRIIALLLVAALAFSPAAYADDGGNAGGDASGCCTAGGDAGGDAGDSGSDGTEPVYRFPQYTD